MELLKHYSLYNSRIDAAAQELQNTNALKLYLFALVSKKQSLCDLIFSYGNQSGLPLNCIQEATNLLLSKGYICEQEEFVLVK